MLLIRRSQFALFIFWTVVLGMPTTAVAQHHAPASAPTSAPVAATNRDRHGPRDVDHYIDMLERPARVQELAPERVVALLEVAADAVVGDIGAGPGVFALPFARACPQGVVFAADVEPRQLDALRERIRQSGLRNIVPVLASYDDAHLPPGRVDLLFIADTYHHLEDRVAYLQRLQGALRPGGRLALLEYKPGDLPMGPPADHKVPVEQRHRELQAAGFRLIHHFDSHRYHDFEVWGPAAPR